MPTNTYIELRKTTVDIATPSVTLDLTGISGYTDLVLVVSGTTGSTVDSYCRINGDTGSNYSYTRLYGTGSSAGSDRLQNQNEFKAGDLTTSVSSHIINFMNYANTTTNKTVLFNTKNSSSAVIGMIGLWRSTSAINSITLFVSGTNFTVGSTFSLYGISDSSVGAKARGGDIYSDSNYYYHVFDSTGAFVPLQSLTADILVVAGGGQGGGGNGGGGGAGGLLAFSSQALTATTHNITVGAGGSGGGTNAAGGNGTNSQFASLTAAVGGGGGGGYSAGAALSGGSGGGGGTNSGNTVPGNGTVGQGNNGGSGHVTDNLSGGGGGAGAVGGAGTTTTSGAGGNGSSAYSSWGIATGTGENVNGIYYYAGGGSGGGDAASGNAIISSAGFGGGGIGGSEITNASAGKSNTGGGGGGEGGGGAGANGGSGVVIVRYLKV